MRVSVFTILCLFVALPAYATDEVCKTLAVHVPAGDVEHVSDHEVPADLNAVARPVLNPIRIPVTVDLVSRYNLDVPADVELKPDVAMIDIYPDGRVLYNGQDLSGRAQDICGQKLPSDGQQVDDAVKSAPQIIDVKEGIQGEILEGEYSEIE